MELISVSSVPDIWNYDRCMFWYRSHDSVLDEEDLGLKDSEAIGAVFNSRTSAQLQYVQYERTIGQKGAL